MSLITTSSSIEIHNPTGGLMFTSTDKLVYLKTSKTGTSSVSSTSAVIPYDSPATGEFGLYYIKITSNTSNAIDDLLNLKIPINTNLQVDLNTYAAGGTANADSVWLAVAQVGDNVIFKMAHTKGTYTSSNLPTIPTIAFTYYFETYSVSLISIL